MRNEYAIILMMFLIFIVPMVSVCFVELNNIRRDILENIRIDFGNYSVYMDITGHYQRFYIFKVWTPICYKK